MTEQEFWTLIQSTRRRDPEAHAERIEKRLAKMSADDVLEFVRLFELFRRAAYRWDLWGAAYVINGGCSDDGFDYFRNWLVLQGQKVYEAALKDPDSLADVVDGEEEVEADIGNPGHALYDRMTDGGDVWEAIQKKHPDFKLAPPDLGEGWDFDDDAEMRKRYPRLYAMYWGDEEEEGDE